MIVGVTYPCGIEAAGTPPLPESCPEHGSDCAALARIAAVLTAELSPWKYNGSEPMCRMMLDAVRQAEKPQPTNGGKGSKA